MQESVRPSTMDFDIEEEKLWKPFLNERTRNELFEKGVIKSIQAEVRP